MATPTRSPPQDQPAPSPEMSSEGSAYNRDHSFTLQAVMDLKQSVGEFGAKIDRLVVDVQGQSDKLTALRTTVDRFKVGVIVAAAILGVLLPAFGTFGWWVLKDRIEAVLRIESRIGAPPIVVPKPN